MRDRGDDDGRTRSEQLGRPPRDGKRAAPPPAQPSRVPGKVLLDNTPRDVDEVTHGNRPLRRETRKRRRAGKA